MKVLVTGGAGYIGSHCVLALMDAGYDVVILDDLRTGHAGTADSLRSFAPEGTSAELVRGNLNEPADLDALFAAHDVSAVVHFAALSQVAESVRDPGMYFRNNVSGTINLLDAMRRRGVDKIVFSSTAAVYGEPAYTPIDEKHPKVPVNPYGMSKLMVENIMDEYDRAYGLRSVRLRYFNVAGADPGCRTGEWHEPETHLIPNVIKAALDSGGDFRLFGTDYPTRDGTCIRDYVDVNDLADAHILALKYLMDGGRTDAFNLGTRTGSTVREVFAACEKVLGRSIPLTEEGRRPGDPAVLVADSTKASEVLGWRPSRTLEDSIRTACAWELRRREMYGK